MPEDSQQDLSFHLRRFSALLKRDEADRAEIERLIHRVVSDESLAVRRMVECRLNSAGRRSVDRQDVDAVTYDALLRLARSLRSFRGKSLFQLRAFEKTIVARTVADYVEQEVRVKAELAEAAQFDEDGAIDALLNIADPSPSPEDRVAHMETLKLVADLDKREAIIIYERKFLGRSSAEVADALDLSSGNVDQIVSRGLKKLRGLWKDLDDE